MCGIGGILSFHERSIERSALERMGQFMQQRGPDHLGIWSNNQVGFVHRRLSIIDLSVGASQPMFSQDESAMICFNGEIYNYPDVKKELLAQGITFKTTSDTEVLVNGYKYFGLEKLLEKIDGMFAFAIYDFQLKKLFLARDRFGKKPLYYYHDNSQFCFSSDIRSLIGFLPKREIDKESLDYYLAELSVPQPKTIFKGISQLEKSCWMVVNTADKSINPKTYWRFDFSQKLDIDFPTAESMVEESLKKAILKRTISDVPIGCFLSGGIDSGLIVSLLASNSPGRIKTFTVAFNEKDYDESAYAAQLAKRYNTDHTELFVTPNIKEDLLDLVDYFGEPFADSSAIPTYYICKAMRNAVTVALSGDGGDELFGYKSYTYVQRVDEFIQQNPNAFLRFIKVNFSKLASVFSSAPNLGALLDTYKKADTGYMLKRGMGFSTGEKQKLFTGELASTTNNFTDAELKRIWSNYKNPDLTSTLFQASFDTRLLNDYLVKVDRASMKSSLEVRSPFLDTDLAVLSGKIPNVYKVKDGTTKVVLRSLAKKYIDPDINLRKKQGFGVPVKHWLKHELKDLVADALSEKQVKARGYFNYTFIQQIIKEHDTGLADHTHKIWSLLWFEFWCRKYMDE